MSEPRQYLDHYDDLARLWIAAEQRADPDRYAGLKWDGLLSVARDRCIMICQGEVRYSECSVGDQAVWHGRPRSRLWDDLPQYMDANGVMHKRREDAEQATNDIEEAMRKRNERDREVSAGSLGTYDPMDVHWSAVRARGQGVREFSWVNVYDTVDFSGADADVMTITAFGNKNIGDPFMTNMQVAGMFIYDSLFIGDTFYVVPKMSGALPGSSVVPWDNAIVELTIGTRPYASMLLADAFVGHTASFRIPQRQCFSARIHLRRPCPGLRVRFHLEGILERDIA